MDNIRRDTRELQPRNVELGISSEREKLMAVDHQMNPTAVGPFLVGRVGPSDIWARPEIRVGFPTAENPTDLAGCTLEVIFRVGSGRIPGFAAFLSPISP